MAEEFRDDDKFVIMADVPGLRPDEEISVSITADVLHIHAGRADGAAVPGTDLRDGAFARDIRLPLGTDEGRVAANYSHGVLEVRAPMRANSGATREVPVSTLDRGVTA
jgi:HSP20 family protein